MLWNRVILLLIFEIIKSLFQCLIHIIPYRLCKPENIKEGFCYYISPIILCCLLLCCSTGRAAGFHLKTALPGHWGWSVLIILCNHKLACHRPDTGCLWPQHTLAKSISFLGSKPLAHTCLFLLHEGKGRPDETRPVVCLTVPERHVVSDGQDRRNTWPYRQPKTKWKC